MSSLVLYPEVMPLRLAII